MGNDNPAFFDPALGARAPLVNSDEFSAALEAHGEQPYFDDERDYKIHNLETEMQKCLENLANHERRLIALEGKNANGRH